MDSNNKTFINFFVFPDSFLHRIGYKHVITLTQEKTKSRTAATLNWHPLSWFGFIWRLALMIKSKRARADNSFKVLQTTGIYLGQVNKELEDIAETPDNCIKKDWVKIHGPHRLGVSGWSYLTTQISIEKNSSLGNIWAELSQKEVPLVILTSIDSQGKNLEVLGIQACTLLPIKVDKTLAVMIQNLYPVLLVADSIELEEFWYGDRHDQKIENGVKEAALRMPI